MKAYNAQKHVKDRTNARQNAARMNALGRAQSLLRVARYRASRLNLPFDLDAASIAYLIEHTVCPYTLQPFVLVRGRSPWAPSIDRIDNSKGYTQDNCSVVSFWWNIAKNKWPEEITAIALMGLKEAIKQMEFGSP